jgi:RNA 2',3'-cyclic 3'-phosphodiesterase
LTGEKRFRTFVALEIGEEMRARIAALQDELRARMPDVRWTRPEGIHLTLRFLGSTGLDQIERLTPMLVEAAASCAPAEVRVAGLGTFPEHGRPSVLWLGLTAPEHVFTLQAACERASVAVGFPREDRRFRPHLTLGRWRERARRPELPSPDFGPSRLETLVLFRSAPQAGGSVYTPLVQLALAGEPAG